MQRLTLHYPVTPHKVNRPWGFADKVYEQFGFARHNGVDLALLHGQAISAPMAGTVINVGNDPKGSGIFVSMISDEEYLFDDGKSAYVLLDFFHCKEIMVNKGDGVVVGQLIALGDNTGCSTGAHTHIQPRREVLRQLPEDVTVNTYRIKNVNYGFIDLDVNDANGTFDPEPYWNGKYASDVRAIAVARLEQLFKEFRKKLTALLMKGKRS